MSRKVIITLAAAATIAAAGLASTSSFAHGFGGFGGGGHMFGRSSGASSFGHSNLKMSHNVSHSSTHSAHSIHKSTVISHLHPQHHWRWAFRGGRWIDVEDVADVAVETPAVELPPAVTPAPCTCLTKTYTPTGLVVFADLCTKESASAPAADDTADASEAPTTPGPTSAAPSTPAPTPSNYAGRTYDDYLAANAQAAQPQTSSQPPQQAPAAPQKN
jgi:hypothetical protein